LKNNFKLYIFDLDGTLVNTEGLYVKSLQSACKDRDTYLKFDIANKLIYGKAWSSIFTDLNKINPGLFNSCDELQKCCSKYFEEMLESEDLEIKPSVDLLKKLAQDNPVCIVSGSSRSHIAHFVKELNLSKYIQFYLGNEDYLNGKPDPECFLKAAETVSVSPEDCLVFEDSTAGVQAAKNAGMHCIGFKSSENPQNISLADQTLDCLGKFSLEYYLNKKLQYN
jgi:beta-phosphoglucomutase